MQPNVYIILTCKKCNCTIRLLKEKRFQWSSSLPTNKKDVEINIEISQFAFGLISFHSMRHEWTDKWCGINYVEHLHTQVMHGHIYSDLSTSTQSIFLCIYYTRVFTFLHATFKLATLCGSSNYYTLNFGVLRLNRSIKVNWGLKTHHRYKFDDCRIMYVKGIRLTFLLYSEMFFRNLIVSTCLWIQRYYFTYTLHSGEHI